MNVDKTDPICGMQGTIYAHDHYFCSEHCLKKYENEHNLSEATVPCPSCAVNYKIPWYKERLYLVLLFTLVVVIGSYFHPITQPFFNAFVEYFQLIWWAVFLGFLIGGIIDFFIPREYIKKYLSRHQKRTIIYSIVFGFLMSACSHGILAIAIELYKKGASTSSVVAFLLASPWANLPITVLLFGFFGWKAFFIVISALIIALISGIIFQLLERKGLVECQSCVMGEDNPILADFSIKNDIKKRWKAYPYSWDTNKKSIIGVFQGAWSLSKMVLWWLLIGMLMASFARAYIPGHLFMTYMGPTIIGLLVTLLFATIIEVCSEGSAPLSFEIFNKTGAFGNSFTFLMAGVATDYTEIGLIYHNIGKKAALWLPIVTVPQILFFAILFNLFL
jgi:uncharacterized membrane protein YraQ (UPF0718 family)